MPENQSPKRNEPEIPSVAYAFWDVPGAAFKVIYSLPLFHEIDFAVNEGYRKIPHGGIEVGGLLFGAIDENSVRIDAFRPIDCEHAYGPALHLSQRDLAEVEKQIGAAFADPGLAGVQPIGWFLAHTRGPLELTDTEVEQFARFFPQPGMLTVLVKPERFQPTRYGFLVRRVDAEMPREAAKSTVILPLPGRAYKPGQLVASIPAPARTSKRVAPAPPSLPTKSTRWEMDNVDAEPPTARSIWKTLPDAAPGGSAPDEIDSRTPEEKAARRQLARDRARVMEGGFPPAEVAPPSRAEPPPIVYDRPAYVCAAYPPPNYALNRRGSRAARTGSVLTPRSITALAMAALLGCLVGYIGYLQLPAAVIPLDVHRLSQSVVVSWPPDETRNSIYAAIRFNDGAPVPLSAEERNSGQVSLAAAKDFKVEVMARNWTRDSRGIVRFLRSANAIPSAVPTATLP